MNRRCPVVFVQVELFFGFALVRVNLSGECEISLGVDWKVLIGLEFSCSDRAT